MGISQKALKRSVPIPASMARPSAGPALEYYGILKRWKLILLIAIIIAAGNIIRVVLEKSIYSAGASMEILPQQLDLGSEGYKDSFEYSSEMFFSTQMELARTPDVLNILVRKIGPDETAKLLGMPPVSWKRSPEELYPQLLRSVQMAQRPDTFILEVGVESPVPKGAAILANTWAESLIESTRQVNVKQGQFASESISIQIERLQKSIEEKNVKLNELSKSTQVQALGEQMNVAMQNMQGLQEQLQAAQAEVIEKQGNYNRIQRSSPSSLPEVISSATVISFQTQCSQAEQEYAEKSKIFKAGWPGLQQLKNKKDEICGQSNREVQNVFSLVLASSRSEVEAARSKQAVVQQEFDQVRNSLNNLNSETSEYQRLLTDKENESKLLDQMIQQRQSADITSTGGMQGNVQMRIVETARTPGRPAKPRRLQSSAVGLFGGLFAGIGVAMLLNFVDTKIRTQADIELASSFRFLTFIPDAEKEEEELIYNSFRFLWRHISAVDEMDKPPRVFIVTSAQPSEGKTFVSTNLAKALAKMGKRVLLIDVDVQRPSVHEVMGIRRQIGLHEFLNAKPPDFTKFPSPLENLTVIPVDHADRLELAASLDGSDFLDALTNAMGYFEYIIMDSGPVLLTPETLAACVGVDGLVLVVRNDYTTTKTLKMADDLLKQMNVNVLGTVLNKVNLQERFSHYQYYRQYYSYYKKPFEKMDEEQTAEIPLASIPQPKKRKKA